jgi:hypothetical protein
MSDRSASPWGCRSSTAPSRMVFSNDFFRFGLDNDETFFQGRETLTKRSHTRVEYRPKSGLVRFSKACRVRVLQLFVSHRGSTTSDTTF